MDPETTSTVDSELAIKETFWMRLRHAVRHFFGTSVRHATEAELALHKKAESCEHRVHELQMRERDINTQLEVLRSQVKVQQTEIDSLIAVIVRNQKRVEAETAAAASDIARCALAKT